MEDEDQNLFGGPIETISSELINSFGTSFNSSKSDQEKRDKIIAWIYALSVAQVSIISRFFPREMQKDFIAQFSESLQEAFKGRRPNQSE